MVKRAETPSTDGGVTPEARQEQLRAFKAAGYTFITFTELMEKRDRAVPGKPLMVTFDDGSDNFLDTGLPILREEGVKSTAFDFTASQDLTWAEWRLTQASGLVDIQSHTITHTDLPVLSDAELKRELDVSRAELKANLGKEVRAIAYPYGSYNERVVQLTC